MPDQNPDALKSQAEAALKKLEEARLHERCPKACKSCSQKHRKCQFKDGHYPKCDLCAKNNRECEIIPSPVSHSRRFGDSGSPTSQSQSYPGSHAYPSSMAPPTLDRSHRASSDAYSSSSPGSPVDARSTTGNSLSSNAYPQNSTYPYNSTNQYAHYPSSQGHNPGSTAQQVHESSAYYVPSLAHIHPPSSSFVSSNTHWSGGQTQAGIGQSYGYSSNMSPARQASAPTVPQIHTGVGQTYMRMAQVSSPASPGGSFPVAGTSMYPPQNTSSLRYGVGHNGQGYDQSLHSVRPGSTNESSVYYQQSMHQ